MQTSRVETLIELCDIADRYYAASKEAYASEFLLQILGTLLDCESILDHGRGIPLHEGDQSLLAPVHQRLDALRANIHELMERIGQDEAARYLESRMHDKQREYSRVALRDIEAL